MRDQRMLDSLKRIPRRTKISLRNYLTRRYPAVPIPSEILRRTDLDKNAVDIYDVNGDGLDEQDESDYIDVGNDLTYLGLYFVLQFWLVALIWAGILDFLSSIIRKTLVFNNDSPTFPVKAQKWYWSKKY